MEYAHRGGDDPERGITDTRHIPVPAGGPSPGQGTGSPAAAPAGRRRRGLAVFWATALATAVCGLPAGLAWAALAPRALLEVTSRGAAQVVNAETSAFIVADAWFCLIGAVGGLLTGGLGYLLAVRRRGAVAAAGLIAGGLAAASVALWVGDNSGLAAFRHRLAVSPPGTQLESSLALGAKSALAFWPMFAALAIAAAEAIVRTRRSRAAARSAALAASAGTATGPPKAQPGRD